MVTKLKKDNYPRGLIEGYLLAVDIQSLPYNYTKWIQSEYKLWNIGPTASITHYIEKSF